MLYENLSLWVGMEVSGALSRGLLIWVPTGAYHPVTLIEYRQLSARAECFQVLHDGKRYLNCLAGHSVQGGSLKHQYAQGDV